MSVIDREKWNARYREGAYAERPHPSVFLEDWIDKIPSGKALDIACGAGRNALFLAERGFEVDAVDISGEALIRAGESARLAGLSVNWLEQDLDAGLELGSTYHLIVIVRYVNLPLIRQLATSLAPGGCLLCEEHLALSAKEEAKSGVEIIGPRNRAFRVQRGALRSAAGSLKICHSEEGLVREPDGRTAALARLVARDELS